ncbi:hypothetical protein LAZ67_1006230 [Cordylochernes scorpioides]|uniref:Peptidase aspartic putative domain-containing protein n=1 Tax=Cordylochernes scorpioides TaxID=51811 RepID=A0ABY6K1I3_9ARAC|nr:hypothetical protein LAZ67_1006230 [Cordylochernes scorpioides]
MINDEIPDLYRREVHSAVYRCIASNRAGAVASRDVMVRAGIFNTNRYLETFNKKKKNALKCEIVQGPVINISFVFMNSDIDMSPGFAYVDFWAVHTFYGVNSVSWCAVRFIEFHDLVSEKGSRDASMYGIGDNSLEKPLGEVDITFSPHYSNMLFTAKALILNKITCNLPNFVMERSRWPHLVGLRLADPTFDKPAPIDIIIGADIAPSLYTGQVRFQNERGPTACNSKLGWLLSGKIMAQQSDGSLHHSVLTFCATSIDNQLRKFWELDSIPPCTQPIRTKEEMDCEQHFKANVLRTTTGRYQRVLWRDSPSDAIQEYKLTTITYGTACAPYLAIRTFWRKTSTFKS